MKKILALSLFVLISISFFKLLGSFPAGAASNFIKSLKVPGSEWRKNMKSGTEVEFYLKGNKDIVNITARIFPDIPDSASTFLVEVRKGLKGEEAYQGAKIQPLRSQSFGGQSWDMFNVVSKAKLSQDFWARKLDSGTVLVVMYTSLGELYEKYRGACENVLQQAAR